MFKKLLQLKLKFWSKLILRKYQPQIIGITGSVGKTSTKEAIYTVLKKKANVRRSIKNYNNEIGVPLTILGLDSPGRSLIGWVILGFKVMKLYLNTDQSYPKVLVLEMGVDKPGDMEYLCSFVKASIGVVTMIGPVHLEYFGTLDKIQIEKGILIKNLPKTGTAILNYDNEQARQLAGQSVAKVITYGFHEKAMVRAEEVIFSFENFTAGGNLRGVSFKLGYNGSYVPVLLPNVVGYNAIYAALAGAAAGVAQGMNLVEIADALHLYEAPKGRMNIIAGIKNTVIIDDTYNASPQAMMAAIEILKRLPSPDGTNKFAVLGDMLELGSYTEEAHREVGRYLVECRINHLIVVGERSRDIARAAKEAGMDKDKIYHFPAAVEAGKFLQERISQGDIILVKGSQGVRMEKTVKEIMAEPLRSKNLLVRQGPEWER